MERFARATAVAAALLAPFLAAPARSADLPAFPAAAIGDAGSEVVFRALSLLGVHYRFGGNTPETGLDCSGLVRLVYRDALGLPLPRRSEEISRVGPAIAPSELQPGDLVFFNTLRRAFSHVGIYIGNNQFVHAPSTGGLIRVENLGADYWTRRFDGARRLLTHEIVAAASMNPLSASAARALQASATPRGVRPDAPLATAGTAPGGPAGPGRAAAAVPSPASPSALAQLQHGWAPNEAMVGEPSAAPGAFGSQAPIVAPPAAGPAPAEARGRPGPPAIAVASSDIAGTAPPARANPASTSRASTPARTARAAAPRTPVRASAKASRGPAAAPAPAAKPGRAAPATRAAAAAPAPARADARPAAQPLASRGRIGPLASN